MKFKSTITIIIASFLALSFYSQVVPPPVPPPPPPGLPIDGGVVLLLVSGALYGFFKLKK